MDSNRIFLTVNSERRSLAWLIENSSAATHVRVGNCPGLVALPELPAATYVGVYNCPGLVALPELAAATHVRVGSCPGLVALPELPAATYVEVYNCPGLVALPELPAATHVWVDNCPGLMMLNAGADKRGYQFVAVRVRGAWRIIAGCRNFSIADARNHWGKGGSSDRPDCLALVERLAAEIEARAQYAPAVES